MSGKTGRLFYVKKNEHLSKCYRTGSNTNRLCYAMIEYLLTNTSLLNI